MRSTIFVVVFGVLTVFLLMKDGTPVDAKQELELRLGRLHEHARSENRRIAATCDTGNGTMIYTVDSGSWDGGVAIAIQPNGCTKK